MSINIPPSLNWLFEIAAGQSWPRGDEDKMRTLRDAWTDAQQKLSSLSDDVRPVAEQVMSNVTGEVADQYAKFVNQLQSQIPALADGADQVAQAADKMALNIETTKYIILGQLIWMAEQIAEWASTIWGLAVVPEIEMIGRLVINRVFRQFVQSVVASIVAMVGIDSAVQAIEMLKGDRKTWDTTQTLESLELGALSGVISGITHIGAGAIAPKFANSLLGHVSLGALDGTLTAYGADGLLGMDITPWMGASAGAVAGGIGKLTSLKPGGDDIAPPDLGNVRPPDVPGDPHGGDGDGVHGSDDPGGDELNRPGQNPHGSPPGGLPGLEGGPGDRPSTAANDPEVSRPPDVTPPGQPITVTGGAAATSRTGGPGGSHVTTIQDLQDGPGDPTASQPAVTAFPGSGHRVGGDTSTTPPADPQAAAADAFNQRYPGTGPTRPPATETSDTTGSSQPPAATGGRAAPARTGTGSTATPGPADEPFRGTGNTVGDTSTIPPANAHSAAADAFNQRYPGTGPTRPPATETSGTTETGGGPATTTGGPARTGTSAPHVTTLQDLQASGPSRGTESPPATTAFQSTGHRVGGGTSTTPPANPHAAAADAFNQRYPGTGPTRPATTETSDPTGTGGGQPATTTGGPARAGTASGPHVTTIQDLHSRGPARSPENPPATSPFRGTGNTVGGNSSAARPANPHAAAADAFNQRYPGTGPTRPPATETSDTGQPTARPASGSAAEPGAGSGPFSGTGHRLGGDSGATPPANPHDGAVAGLNNRYGDGTTATGGSGTPGAGRDGAGTGTAQPGRGQRPPQAVPLRPAQPTETRSGPGYEFPATLQHVPSEGPADNAANATPNGGDAHSTPETNAASGGTAVRGQSAGSQTMVEQPPASHQDPAETGPAETGPAGSADGERPQVPESLGPDTGTGRPGVPVAEPSVSRPASGQSDTPGGDRPATQVASPPPATRPAQPGAADAGPPATDIQARAIVQQWDHYTPQDNPLAYESVVSSINTELHTNGYDAAVALAQQLGSSRGVTQPWWPHLLDQPPAAHVPGPPAPVLREHTWADPASGVVVRSGFDAHRELGGDGRPVTVLTVGVHLHPDEDVTPADLNQVWDLLTKGVSETYNAPGHRLPNGDQLHVQVVPADQYGHAHLDVAVHAPAPGAGPGAAATRPMTQHDWLTGRAPVVYAHEIGHQLGLRDESGTSSRTHTLHPATGHGPITPITITRTAGNEGSLLGHFTTAPPDPTLVQGGLRPRHLALLHTLAGDLPDPTSGPGASESGHGPGTGDHQPGGGDSPRAPTVPVATETSTASTHAPAAGGGGAGHPGEVEQILTTRRTNAPSGDGQDAVLGPDPFGLRQLPPAPAFLHGFRYDHLHADRREGFFNALDLTRAQPPTAHGLNPSRLQRGPVSEGVRVPRNNSWIPRTKPQRVPHLTHSIWIGGPLYHDGGVRQAFMETNATLGRPPGQGGPATDFQHVLWTDVPRARFGQIGGADPASDSENDTQVRQMLDWARQNGIRLVNIDEVFNRQNPAGSAPFIQAERGIGDPMGYARASDLLRVEILHRFGGLYSDGDNRIVGDPAQATRAAAGNPHGLALGAPTEGLTNSAAAAAAGSRGARAYQQVLQDNQPMSYAALFLRRYGAADVPPDESDLINQENVTGQAAVLDNTSPQETVLRTGPHQITFIQLARQLGLSGDDPLHELPTIPDDVFEVNFANSWVPRPASGHQPASSEQVANAVTGAVTALHAQAGARPGGIWLPAAARTINRLPEPQQDHAWQLTLTTYHDTLPDDGLAGLRWISAHNVRITPATSDLLHQLFPNLAHHGSAESGDGESPPAPAVPAATTTITASPPASAPGGDGSRHPDEVEQILAGQMTASPSGDGQDGTLGPDPFGVRQLPPAPAFLRGFRYDNLHADRREGFFNALDLTRVQPPTAGGLAPARLPRGPVSEGVWVPRNSTWIPFPRRLRVPHLTHSIWMGGPLYHDGGVRQAFMETNATLGRPPRQPGAAPDFQHVLWTDVPRARFAQVRAMDPGDGSADDTHVRQMQDWAQQNGIRLASIDEVFNQEAPAGNAPFIQTERWIGDPMGYARASDLLRVEILNRFGGLYADGDNPLTGDRAQATRAAAGSLHGLALGSTDLGLTNSAVASAARSPGTLAYQQVLHDNQTLTYARLFLRRYDIAADPDQQESDLYHQANVTGQDNVQDNTSPDETVRRTGPNHVTYAELARQLGLRGEDPPSELTTLPDGIFTVHFANSWVPRPSEGHQPAASSEQVARAVIGAVTALHAQAGARPGGLWLPAAARTINRLPGPQQDHAWQLTLAIFHGTLPPAGHTALRWVSGENVPVSAATRDLLDQLFPGLPYHGSADPGGTASGHSAHEPQLGEDPPAPTAPAYVTEMDLVDAPEPRIVEVTPSWARTEPRYGRGSRPPASYRPSRGEISGSSVRRGRSASRSRDGDEMDLDVPRRARSASRGRRLSLAEQLAADQGLRISSRPDRVVGPRYAPRPVIETIRPATSRPRGRVLNPVPSRTQQLLDIGNSVIRQVQRRIDRGPSNQAPSISAQQGAAAARLWAVRNVARSYPPSTLQEQLGQSAAAAEAIGSGNCGEHAAMSFALLNQRDLPPGVLIYHINLNPFTDHVFVAIGSPRDPFNIVVIDPWQQRPRAVLATEFNFPVVDGNGQLTHRATPIAPDGRDYLAWGRQTIDAAALDHQRTLPDDAWMTLDVNPHSIYNHRMPAPGHRERDRQRRTRTRNRHWWSIFSSRTPATPAATSTDYQPLARRASTGQAGPAVRREHSWADPASGVIVRSGFDAHRELRGDGRPVTVLTVGVHLHPDADVSHDDLRGLWNLLARGVHEAYNAPGHRLPNGDQLHVEVVAAGDYGHAHINVAVHAPAPGARPSAAATRPMTQHDWLTGRAPVVYAHEIGHQLGLRDESGGASRTHHLGAAGAGTDLVITRTASNQGSLLGDFTATPPGNLPPAGLRPRHLALLHALAGDLPDPASSPAADQRHGPLTEGRGGPAPTPQPGEDPPTPTAPAYVTEMDLDDEPRIVEVAPSWARPEPRYGRGSRPPASYRPSRHEYPAGSSSRRGRSGSRSRSGEAMDLDYGTGAPPARARSLSRSRTSYQEEMDAASRRRALAEEIARQQGLRRPLTRPVYPVGPRPAPRPADEMPLSRSASARSRPASSWQPSRTEQLLRIGDAVIRDVQRRISHGPSNQMPAITAQHGAAVARLWAVRNVASQQASGQLRLGQMAAAAEAIGSGNCGEHAAMAFTLLNRARLPRGVMIYYVDLNTYGLTDHVFAAIGYPNDPRHIVVVDPWQVNPRAVLATEFNFPFLDSTGRPRGVAVAPDGHDYLRLGRQTIDLDSLQAQASLPDDQWMEIDPAHVYHHRMPSPTAPEVNRQQRSRTRTRRRWSLFSPHAPATPAATEYETTGLTEPGPAPDLTPTRDLTPAPEPAPTPAPARPPAPWYVRGVGGVHALGDMEVVSVTGAADAAGQAAAFVRQLAAGPAHPQRAATGGARSGRLRKDPPPAISRALQQELTAKITAALNSADPAQWATYLRSGLTAGSGDSVVRVWFRLRDHAPAELPPPDPVLKSSLTKYGDTTYEQSDKRVRETSLGLLGDGLIPGSGGVSFWGVSASVASARERSDTHGFAGEVQSGSRAFSALKSGATHGISVEAMSFTTHGGGPVRMHEASTQVPGVVITAAHPRVLGPDDPSGAREVPVSNPGAIEGFDYTLGAVDTRALEVSLIRTLMSSGQISAAKAAELIAAAVKEITDEKSLRDRNQYLFSGALPSNYQSTGGFAQRNGFSGYIRLTASLRSVQDVGVAAVGPDNGGGIRNDIAETVTVSGATGHANHADAEAGFSVGLAGGVSAGATLSVSARSGHATSASISGQPKMAIIHHGAQRRFGAVIAVRGEIHSDGLMSARRTQSFAADVQGEVLVPEQQADAFVAALGTHPAPVARPAEPARPAGTGKLRRRPDHPGVAARGRATGLFPPAGLPGTGALVTHLESGRGLTVVRVPHGFDVGARFTGDQQERLARLQQRGRLRIFEDAPAGGGEPQRITITPARPGHPRKLQKPANRRPGGTGPQPMASGLVVHRTVATQAELAPAGARRGYVLDADGTPGHGWDRQRAMLNPAAMTGRPPTVQPAAAVLGPPFQVTGSVEGLLSRPGLPPAGEVLNPAGQRAWGWQPAPGVPAWREPGDQPDPALVALMRQAARSGLQLVIGPDTSLAARLRDAGREVSAAPAAERLAMQAKFAAAMENHGAGLGRLTPAELRRLLVSDRSVRIVDESGMIDPGLNARAVYRMRGNEKGESVATAVLPDQPDPSVRLGEEYAHRGPDGGFSRSVTWTADDRLVPHVRRAWPQAHPRQQTPELAAGLGLGSAAVKELPGAEQVHEQTRSIILGMINRDRDATGYGQLSAFDRYTLDKRLQEAFSVPKLRASRSRGYDAGLSERVEVGRNTYDISVTQVLVRPGPAGPGTEPGIGVDHQAKGARGGSSDVERSVTFGPGVEVAARIPRNAAVSADLGEVTAQVAWRRQANLSMSTATKQYTRLRSPAAEAGRADYEVRYQITVTETGKPVLGVGPPRQRTVSRIVQGDDVHVPAIVHPAFRPGQDTGADPAHQAAFRHVAATMGRTTTLTPGELGGLTARKLDFSQSGTTGLHVFLTGLRDAVRHATDLVLQHTEDGDAPPAAHVAAIDKALTEGFLRANLHRLLSPEGLPVPLPAEDHTGNPLRPNIRRALNVRGFLVPGDPAASHGTADASGETYVEDDTKLTATTMRGHRWGGSAAAGPVIKVGPTAGNPAGGGRSASRRAVESRVGGAVGVSADWTPDGTLASRTGGSIDLGVLTEGQGQQVTRAHLVLELTSSRQPADSGWAERQAGALVHGPSSQQPSTRTAALLIENAAELSLSATLHDDLDRLRRGETRHLAPADEPARHITRDATALAAGYPTLFDDRQTPFSGSVAQGSAPATFTVGRGGGITGAIRAALSRSGLIRAADLNDTSDTWRAITARFNAAELGNHLDDLRGVGVVHRAELPGPANSTRQVTIVARATAVRLAHVRSRAAASVTFGGQALAQTGRSKFTEHRTTVSGDLYGMGTADNAGYGQAGASLARQWAASRTSGSQTVDRDIRRAAARGQGEEFAGHLDVTIDIHTGTEWPEPLRRWPEALRPPGTAPRPAVTIHSAPDRPVAFRLVVPRHLTGSGAGPDRSAEPARPAPAVRVSGAPSASSGLDDALGERLLPLHFPDLDQVAGWAPVTTLGAGTAAGHAGKNQPPAVREFTPTSDRAVWLNLTLANRNVRNNVRDLFGEGLALSPDTGQPGRQPIRLTARARVIRPVGRPADYNGLSFAERAEEPTYQRGKTRKWAPGFYSGGGTDHGVGQPGVTPSSLHSQVAEGYNGDYVEYNQQFSAPAHLYRGDFSYEITGPHGYALRLDTGAPFDGLLLTPWARDLATRFPGQVVHPDATELPADPAARDTAITGLVLQATSTPDGGEPLRLFADPEDGGDPAPFTGAAEALVTRLRQHGVTRAVELAVVRYAGGRPDGLSLHHHESPGRGEPARPGRLPVIAEEPDPAPGATG